jgi:hypothetical protein
MKNIIALVVVASMGLSSLAMAGPSARSTPYGSDGQAINHPLYGGYSYAHVDATTEAQVCSGRCLLAGLFRGTGTAYMKVRDTAVLGSSATGVVVWEGGSAVSETNVYANPIALPLVLTRGITLELSAAGSVTVAYIDLDPGVSGPQD